MVQDRKRRLSGHNPKKMDSDMKSWKKLALEFYFKLYGRRCIICSKPVEVKVAHLEHRENEYYLMHQKCWTQETK
jgi:hypothetical protein